MPNWCYNEISIDGITEDDVAIKQAFEGNRPFELLRPCPAELDEDGAHSYGGEDRQKYDDIRARLKVQYGYNNGYDWRVANWGTKWDACDIDQIGPSHYCFSTAWAPPCDLYKYLAEKYPRATFSFTFEEGGAGFQGEGSVIQGSYTEDTWDYPYESEEEEDECPNLSVPTKVVIGSDVPPKLP